jgi:hypothetical protein
MSVLKILGYTLIGASIFTSAIACADTPCKHLEQSAKDYLLWINKSTSEPTPVSAVELTPHYSENLQWFVNGVKLPGHGIDIAVQRINIFKQSYQSAIPADFETYVVDKEKNMVSVAFTLHLVQKSGKKVDFRDASTIRFDSHCKVSEFSVTIGDLDPITGRFQ